MTHPVSVQHAVAPSLRIFRGLRRLGFRSGWWIAFVASVPVGWAQPGSRTNLSPNARRVVEFLESQRGVKMLAGQEEAGGDLRAEQEKLLVTTGRRPAIRGWDVRAEGISPFEEARRSWLNERQLVEFSWHVGLPPGPDTFDQAKEPSDPNVTVAQVAAVIADVLAPGTVRNRDFMAKLDRVATQLAALQADDIPVLWRPFHEAEADFGRVGRSPFWWGKAGAGPFKELWRFEYDYFTRVRGLNNLVWIYSTLNNPVNGWPGDSSDWFPGDDVVDIVGSDIYRDGVRSDNNTAWATWCHASRELGHGRLVALTENDLIPDPQAMKSRGALFSWFLSWHTTFVGANDPAFLTMVYNHVDVATADEMPNLRGPFYQAEAATLVGGSVESSVPGFTGSGYAALAADGWAEFSVDATLAGPHVLSFFYSNGGSEARSGGVTVNQAAVASVRLAPTGDVAAWRPAETVALLNAGRNTIRVAVDGALQLDGLAVVLAPVEVAVQGGGRLVNLSTRARVGAQAVTGGFVLTGPGQRGVLVRAAGPALGAFGVSGALMAPQLRLVDSAGLVLATNTGWSTNENSAARIRAAAESSGAFPFANGSGDCAIVAPVGAGGCTAQITGTGGAGGEALVEIYAPGGDTLTLANLSTRVFIGGGSPDPLAGFVISGGPRTLLLRGIGPGLTRFGVGGAAADPTLSVFSAKGTRLFGNDNWSSGLAPGAVAAAATRCGAFPLVEGSRDAALVATLPAGAYTLQLHSLTAAGGEGLVEIYVLP